MNRITRGLAAKAAEDFNVSEQNREVWAAGFAAGFDCGSTNAYLAVANKMSEVPQNTAKAEE